jgi:hypothetical protein
MLSALEDAEAGRPVRDPRCEAAVQRLATRSKFRRNPSPISRPLPGAIVLLVLAGAPTAFAGRPLIVDDAYPVDPQTFEFEAGISYFRTDSPHSYDVPFGLTYGLVRTLEIGVGFGGRIEAREDVFEFQESDGGLGDLVTGAKWNPLSADQWFFDHAVGFSVKFPTADSDLGTGQMDYDLTYIASKTLSDDWSAHLNAGYTWVGDTEEEPLEDIFHAGVAAGWFVHERVELVSELYTDVLVGRERDSALSIAGGARWNAFGGWVFDALVGAGLSGVAPDWRVAFGFTWAFDFKKGKLPQ